MFVGVIYCHLLAPYTLTCHLTGDFKTVLVNTVINTAVVQLLFSTQWQILEAMADVQ